MTTIPASPLPSTIAPPSPALIEVRAVSKRFTRRLDVAARLANWFGAKQREETVHAVDGVDLSIAPGEVVGLVGESGCGKSTLGRIMAGIYPPTAGKRYWQGVDIAAQSPAEQRRVQLQTQMIFQDPYASLNPRLRVEDAIGEAPVVHGLVKASERREFVAELMRRVGLDAAYLRRFPHQFSGGQRARIGIARALAVKPQFLVCDESVAALDVSIQAQVLNLFMDLRADLGLTYLFISHDLSVVQHVADRVVIMYLGRIVEVAPTEAIYKTPNHPYAVALLGEVRGVTPNKRAYIPIKGEIPSPLAPPSGCHFHPRCPHAMPRCATEVPSLRSIAPGRYSACHLNDPA
jgi:peptide/nickel transport system ATP-binding protein